MPANHTTDSSVTDTWWNVSSFPQQGFSRSTCAVKSWLLFAVTVVAGLSQSAACILLPISGPEAWHMLFPFISFLSHWFFSLKLFTGKKKLDENFLKNLNNWMIFTAGNCMDRSKRVWSINTWTETSFLPHRDDCRKKLILPRVVQTSSYPLSYKPMTDQSKKFLNALISQLPIIQKHNVVRKWSMYTVNCLPLQPESKLLHTMCFSHLLTQGFSVNLQPLFICSAITCLHSQ